MVPGSEPEAMPGAGRGGPAAEPWTEVRDREELRRRLERLAAADAIQEEDVDLVLFFFRASDPVLYPLAAVALGRGLVSSTEEPVRSRLASWLVQYARSRGIPLRWRVPLDGVRSNRRVLLTAAAACARDRTAWQRLIDPEGGGEEMDSLVPLPSELPAGSSADIATYLRASRLLLEGRPVSAALRAHTREILYAVARQPELLRDAVTATRWGELLAAVGQRGAEEGRGAAREGGGVEGEGGVEPEELALRRVAVAFLEEAFEAASSGIGPRVALLRAVDGIVQGSRGLAGGGSAAGGTQASGARRETLLHTLRTVADAREWWAQDEGRRARTAFFLLGVTADPHRSASDPHLPVSDPHLPVRELGPLLDAFGFPPSAGIASRVLLLLAEREGVEPGALVDATLIHSLEDEGLLLRLLPTGSPGEVGAAVADALEHRIRMGLATDPGFRPEELLFRIEARRPHPAFFQIMRTLVADREYARADGTVVPLASWLQILHAEAKSTREGRARAVVDPSTLSTKDAPYPGEDPLPLPGTLGATRTRFRRELRTLAAHDDPLRMVQGLSALLHGGRPERSTEDVASIDPEGPMDIHVLLRILEGEGAGVLGLSLQRRARALREEGERMVPLDLVGVAEARMAGEAVQEHLHACVSELAPRLPAVEAGLFTQAARAARASVTAWLAALDEVEIAWRGTGPGEWEVGWERVLGAAASVAGDAHRERLLPVVWRTMASPAARAVPDGRSEEDGRLDRLIRWAVRSGAEIVQDRDREQWLGTVAHEWTRMVEAGIEEGLETRVARLVQEPGQGTLATLPGVDGVLERVRVWFFDCYRIQDAARITGVLNLRRGHGVVRTLPRDLLAFFLHYSPVWLALLVGAILMLDFGDAWTAMADVGDVRGIGVTFALGVVGAFGYVSAELNARVNDAPGDRVWLNRGRRLFRALVFVGVCLLYTFAVVGLLWWLLSGTDEVVHGAGAFLHVVVWSGFALFVGIFFGLIAKGSA